MPREAEAHQRIAVLRALARRIAEERRAHDEPPAVRIYEDTRPQPGDKMLLRVEVPRAEFWAAVAALRPRGQVESGRVYQGHPQQSADEERVWSRALDVVYSLAEYVERGYPLLVDRGPHGMPASSSPAAATRTLALTVNMHAYDSIAAHWPAALTPNQVVAPRAG